MNMEKHRGVFIAACVALSGLGIAGCGNGASEGWTGTSLDPLLVGDGGAGAFSRDGGENACAACIQQSCDSELTALEAELKTLRSEAMSAFTCVKNDSCMSLFWSDAGAGGKAAVSACIESCDTSAGLPSRDAAKSDISPLAQALETCVQSSCSSTCPAMQGPGGRGLAPPQFDGGGFTPPPFDGGSFAPPHFDAGSFTPPPVHFDAGSFTPPARGDAGFGRP
jgi:hypothetical protein